MMPQELPSLRVLTFNVFFDPVAQSMRYREILNICQRSQAQVLLFQEVTTPFIRLLQQTDWLCRDYECSDPDFSGRTIQPYGVCTLARKDLLPTFSFHNFPSHMDRRLLLSTLTLTPPSGPPHRLLIGNVHLESLANHPTRIRQLTTCHSVFAQAAAAPGPPLALALLAGDFNFCSYSNFIPSHPLENAALATCLPGWQDLWEQLRNPATDKGYTFDTCANGFTEAMARGRLERMRYDRIMLLPLGAGAWEPKDIQLVGTEPIQQQPEADGTGGQGRPGLGIDPHCPPACIFPSDHFGLLASFSHPGGRS